MESKYALIITILIILVVIGNYLFFKNLPVEHEQVIVGRIIDGDTVELEDGRTVRLVNINTPEKGQAFSQEATLFLENLKGETVGLEKAGIEKYGRLLGRLYGEEYVNLEIVKLGLGHKYLVDEKEEKEFAIAEKNARDSEKGIWKRSENYGCLTVEINKYEEYVEIEDKCELDFSGWTMKDESTKSYKLDKVGAKLFKIYSQDGLDTQDEFYWGRGSAWNDDKDSIFIRDAGGFLAYYDSYGH